VQGKASGSGTESDETQPGVSILLVDDDVELCDLMREYFAQNGMSLETVHDGRRGLARALAETHDLVLRKKLRGRGDLIRTVRAVGYLFCAEAGQEAG
jgi:DNA-binding response OmpR family regulator